jgi:Uma2 family endonuclease
MVSLLGGAGSGGLAHNEAQRLIMATSTLISVAEYLSTSYRPDCDYVDGEVQERNLGEYDHGKLQGILYLLLHAKRKEWQIRVAPEIRVQVKPMRFRVPDVCVLAGDAPTEQIIHYPPLLCIEVLAPSDTIARMRDRIRDYLEMGVRQVWLLDPASRSAMICVGNTMTEQTEGMLRLPATSIELTLAEVFDALDEA